MSPGHNVFMNTVTLSQYHHVHLSQCQQFTICHSVTMLQHHCVTMSQFHHVTQSPSHQHSATLSLLNSQLLELSHLGGGMFLHWGYLVLCCSLWIISTTDQLREKNKRNLNICLKTYFSRNRLLETTSNMHQCIYILLDFL